MSDQNPPIPTWTPPPSCRPHLQSSWPVIGSDPAAPAAADDPDPGSVPSEDYQQAPSFPQYASPAPGFQAPSSGGSGGDLVVAIHRDEIAFHRICERCACPIDIDDYCQQCGAKAPESGDHVELDVLWWVGGVCDRGIRHVTNEDAIGLAARRDRSWALAVVCDGVSSAPHSDQAALAAVRAVIESLVASRSNCDHRVAIGQALSDADSAVIAASPPDDDPASCTLALGLWTGEQIVAANLGDSRVYWIPDQSEPKLLTRDHSMAQDHIDLGVDRQIAESSVHSHVITRWLGKDAPDITPNIVVCAADEPGWILVCSDGLWNYASDPDQMAQRVHELAASNPQALKLAKALVDWANSCGGIDNISAQLIRVDGRAATEESEDSGRDLIDAPTTRTRPRKAHTDPSDHPDSSPGNRQAGSRSGRREPVCPASQADIGLDL